jgi:cell division topological specificity factor
MVGFFDWMLGRGKDNSTGSANRAKERLQVVLVHDRINIAPEQLDAMKREILEVISKYVNVSSDHVDIALHQHDRNSNKIVAEIPFSATITDEDPDENNDLPTFDDDDQSYFAETQPTQRPYDDED